MKKARVRFFISSLGCPKNTVDSSAMAFLLQRAGYRAVDDAAAADLVIINTCGFIAPAREESFATLQELAAQKTPRQRLIAAGCWSQRAPEALLEAIPELDAVIGTRSWPGIVELSGQLLAEPGTTFSLIEQRQMAMPEEAEAPGYAITGKSAFLKIADGCSRMCAFCAIPLIKGPTVSRSLDAILADARALRELGVLEVNLIAQDATFYGHDLGRREGLADLLERLAGEIPDVPWIRVLYAFPGYITERLMDVMARYPQILPYIDIPLQHAHPDVLRRMRRPADMAEVRHTITRLREVLPDVALRTTLIVGFPGETDAEFAALLEFVNEIRFDRLGVFTYSEETGTHAANLPDDVPEDVKYARREALMFAQQDISLEKNRALVGKQLQVLLEGTGDGVTVGRSYRDAPEIDGLVIVPEEVPPGRMVTVEVESAMVYDVTGRVVDSTRQS